MHFQSLAAFYDDPRRWRSDERDYGLAWRAADGRTFRVAWVADTRELYSVEHMTADGRGGAVEVLARLPAEAVDDAMSGWDEVCGQPDSYEWFRARAAAATANAAPARPAARRRRSRGERSRAYLPAATERESGAPTPHLERLKRRRLAREMRGRVALALLVASVLAAAPAASATSHIVDHPSTAADGSG